jgi:hypothetical protein
MADLMPGLCGVLPAFARHTLAFASSLRESYRDGLLAAANARAAAAAFQFPSLEFMHRLFDVLARAVSVFSSHAITLAWGS